MILSFFAKEIALQQFSYIVA